MYYKRLFDSIVLGSFSRELSFVEYGGLKGRNSPYFTFLLPEREKRVESDQKNDASKANKKMCDVYGADTLSVRVAQQWFERFRSGVVEMNDAPRGNTLL